MPAVWLRPAAVNPKVPRLSVPLPAVVKILVAVLMAETLFVNVNPVPTLMVLSSVRLKVPLKVLVPAVALSVPPLSVMGSARVIVPVIANSKVAPLCTLVPSPADVLPNALLLVIDNVPALA